MRNRCYEIDICICSIATCPTPRYIVIGDIWTRYDRVYTHAGVAKLARVPHTHLKVIATPKECQEAKKQRPEAPRSSAQKRPGNIWWREGENELTNVWDI